MPVEIQKIVPEFRLSPPRRPARRSAAATVEGSRQRRRAIARLHRWGRRGEGRIDRALHAPTRYYTRHWHFLGFPADLRTRKRNFLQATMRPDRNCTRGLAPPPLRRARSIFLSRRGD